jgi:cyclic pyranopterin phosphate synthase
MLDSYGRRIDYLRISLTDKCNLRCSYCLPHGVKLVPMEDLLTLEEIAAIVRCGAGLGIDRIRLTGGEPLVRRGLPELMAMLQGIEGLKEVAMTTNGLLLRQYLPMLKERGLKSVNISLDTLDAEIYRQITGYDGLQEVLAAIDAALSAGLKVKVNAVLMAGINADSYKDLAGLAKAQPLDVRFIELMPIGEGRHFMGVSNEALLQDLERDFGRPERDDRIHGNGPARYYRIPGFQGSIGFISAMHRKFCGSCNRIRLTAMGELKPCLCYDTAVDLRTLLRTRGEAALPEAIRQAVARKPEAHCFETADHITEQRRMASIGG